jgi:hypothetical protein
MDSQRLYLDSVELRDAANQIRATHRDTENVAKALPWLAINLQPDDPLRTHRSFMDAFRAFTLAWGRETRFLAEANRDIANDLDAAARVLVDKMCQIAKDTAAVGPPQ